MDVQFGTFNHVVPFDIAGTAAGSRTERELLNLWEGVMLKW